MLHDVWIIMVWNGGFDSVIHSREGYLCGFRRLDCTQYRDESTIENSKENFVQEIPPLVLQNPYYDKRMSHVCLCFVSTLPDVDDVQ